MDKTWGPLPMISLASFHWVKLILPLETHQILRFLYHEVNPILTSNSKLTPINQDLPHMKNLEMRIVLEDKHLLGLGKTTNIANTCVYLLSDASRWVTGQNLVVDGGYTAR